MKRRTYNDVRGTYRADLRAAHSRGQGLAEYIIIVIIVALLVIFGLRRYGGSLFGRFQDATQEISTAAKSTGPAKVGEGGEGSNQPDNGMSKPESGGESAAGQSEKATAELPQNDLNQQVSRLSSGVGDNNQAPIDAIEIDWKTLAFIGAIIFAFGVFIVFRESRSNEGGDKPKKKKKKEKKKSLFSKDEGGQAIAEFVIIAITFLFVILGILQFALILNAYSLVRYAAYNAARAAIVHGGDEEKMKEAARLSLLGVFPSHGRADHVRGFYENYLGAKATDDNPFLTMFNEPITKVEIVESPNRTSGEVVTFDDPVDAQKGIITVKVTHLYELVIPLANRILFYVFRLNRNGPGYSGQTVNEVSALSDKERRTGDFVDQELRLPLVGVYTMRLQSDFTVP